MNRILRCYAEGRRDRWEAVCLDFDIAVQGGSFSEVHENLVAAIAEYIAYVGTLSDTEQRRLLSRRAPVALRLKFLWHALLTSFSDGGGGDGDAKERAEFLVPATA